MTEPKISLADGHPFVVEEDYWHEFATFDGATAPHQLSFERSYVIRNFVIVSLPKEPDGLVGTAQWLYRGGLNVGRGASEYSPGFTSRYRPES